VNKEHKASKVYRVNKALKVAMATLVVQPLITPSAIIQQIQILELAS
jgi:hypothetical protein